MRCSVAALQQSRLQSQHLAGEEHSLGYDSSARSRQSEYILLHYSSRTRLEAEDAWKCAHGGGARLTRYAPWKAQEVVGNPGRRHDYILNGADKPSAPSRAAYHLPSFTLLIRLSIPSMNTMDTPEAQPSLPA